MQAEHDERRRHRRFGKEESPKVTSEVEDLCSQCHPFCLVMDITRIGFRLRNISMRFPTHQEDFRRMRAQLGVGCRSPSVPTLGSVGKLTVTDKPHSGLGRTSSLAPCAWAMSATMDRPRPRPFGLAVRSGADRWKGSSRRPTWSGATEGPVLVTVNVASVVFAASLSSTRPSVTL